MKSSDWRRMNAAAWWVASRLCHRNSGAYLLDTYPLDGFYDVLSIRHASEPTCYVDLNRNGSVHVHGVPDGTQIMPLRDLVTSESLEDVVQSLEARTGWQRPRSGSRTTRRVLTYRVLATVLQATVDSRAHYEVRLVMPIDYDDMGYDPTPQWSSVASLPGAEPFRTAAVDPSAPLEPTSAMWGVFCDQRAVALLDSQARVLTDRGVLDLLPIYRATSRRLVATTASALGHLLP